MSGHTPEPWELFGHAIHKEGECLAYLNGCSLKNARRIVACVNACKNILLEVLEAPGYSVKEELDTLDWQIKLRIENEKRVDELEEQITLLTR